MGTEKVHICAPGGGGDEKRGGGTKQAVARLGRACAVSKRSRMRMVSRGV